MGDYFSFEHCETVDFNLKMPLELYEDLKFVSNFCGRDQEYLVNCYIANGLTRIMSKIKMEKFLTHAKELLTRHEVPEEVVEQIVEKFNP